jgi:hypothetical protein
MSRNETIEYPRAVQAVFERTQAEFVIYTPEMQKGSKTRSNLNQQLRCYLSAGRRESDIQVREFEDESSRKGYCFAVSGTNISQKQILGGLENLIESKGVSGKERKNFKGHEIYKRQELLLAA